MFNPYLYLVDTTSTSITTATINENCKFIGDSAFYNFSSLTNVYYNGTAQEWNKISIDDGNYNLTSATRYYYIDNEEDLPNDGGNYRHYVNGVPTVWTKTEN